MHALFASIALVLSAAAHAWVEDEIVLGTGSPVTVYATYDIPAIRPVLEAFAAQNPDLQLIYRVASSQSLHEHVSLARKPDADLVFSSAVALQMKAVNEGLGQSFDLTGPGSAWRKQLYTLSVEPIVSVYNTELAPWIGAVSDRNDLARKLDEGLFALPQGAMSYDPAASGVGYQLITQDIEQPNVFQRFYGALARQGIELACCTADMVDAVEQGRRTLAVNLLQSYAASRLGPDSPLAIKVWTDYQLVIPRTAYLPSWAPNPEGAQRFAQFVRVDGQTLIPTTNQIAPARQVTAPQKEIRLTPALVIYLEPFKRARTLRDWNALIGAQPE